MRMDRFEKIQAGLGCFILLCWLGGLGVAITLIVLLFKALIKYISS